MFNKHLLYLHNLLFISGVHSKKILAPIDLLQNSFTEVNLCRYTEKGEGISLQIFDFFHTQFYKPTQLKLIILGSTIYD
jgi:cellobiose-specific phosphotransferase system component IIC